MIFAFFFFPLLFAALVGSKGGVNTRARRWMGGFGVGVVSDLCLGRCFFFFSSFFLVFLSLGLGLGFGVELVGSRLSLS